jgi:nucleotide-binding universal stress UspA family protein
MKHLLQSTALGLAALVVTSCATTNVVQVWRDPNYRPAPIRRVLVVGVIPDAGGRLAFENAVAQAFIKQDFEVATSSGFVPPGQPANDRIASYAKEMGVDLVVVLRLVTSYGAWYGATDINVYAAKSSSEFPVWSGTTNTSNFSTAQEAATSVAASLVYALASANVLVR